MRGLLRVSPASWRVAVAGLALLGCALVASIAITAGASAAGRPHPRVIASLPTHVEVGHVLRVAGRVTGALGASSVVLERQSGRHWRVLVTAPVRRGRFTLSWRATPVGSATLRLVVRRRKVSLVSSPAKRLSVSKAATPLPGSGQGSTPSQPGTGPSAGAPGGGGPTPAPSPTHACTPAGPPSVPAGDGWITGGAYLSGGGASGVSVCLGSYTVNVLNEAGATVASTHVTEHNSFTFVLAPGRYKLSGVCRPQSVTVRAGQETNADIICTLL